MNKIKELVIQVLVDNKIDPSKNFILDSVVLVELMVVLEDETGILLDNNVNKLYRAHNLNEILHILKKVEE